MIHILKGNKKDIAIIMSIHQINTFIIPASSFISKIYQIIDKFVSVYSTTLNSEIIADFHFIQTKSSILLSIEEKKKEPKLWGNLFISVYLKSLKLLFSCNYVEK